MSATTIRQQSRPGETTLRRLLEPVAGALDDHETTEVCINRPDEYWVERAGVFERHIAPGLDFNRLDAIATLAAAMTSQDIGPDRPLCASVLPDGQRVQICRPPAVDHGLVSITIRRPSAFVPTLDLLAKGGLFNGAPERTAPHHAAGIYPSGSKDEFLAAAVKARRNILICGRTGSGKTTLGAAVARQIPADERLITIEDTPEWTRLPQRNRVALYYSKGDQGAARVRSEELLEASLRMRPDRVLMQELRDGAAFTYLRAVVAGHPGSITTCHAETAAGAFDALRLMVRQHPAGATLGDADVRALLRQMVHVVVHCEREGNRFYVTDILTGDAIRKATEI